MKALTIKPHWLQLIMKGQKQVEFRRWRPKLMPPFELALCSSRKFTRRDEEHARSLGLSDDDTKAIRETLGYARCIVTIAEIREVTATYEDVPGYSPRARWAWHLAALTPIRRPVPVQGQIYLFDIDERTR